MPYYFDPNLDKDKDENATQVQLSGAAPVATASGAPAANQPRTASKDVNSGSGFQNLDKYYATNNAKAFGGQVLGKVGEQVQGANQQMNQAADQFKQKVSAGGPLATQQDINAALANPMAANADQFKAWREQEYKGPKSLAESQDVWNKYWSGAKQAQTSAGLLGNESGRFALLDQYYGKPTYSTGQKSLDNLLVQQSGLGQQTRKVQNQAAQLQSQGEEKAKELQGMASQRAGEIEQNRNMVTQATQNATAQQQQAIQSKVAQANAARVAQQNAIQSGLGQNQLPEEIAQQLRGGGKYGSSLFDLDLNNYFSRGGELGVGQVSTAEERARLGALAQLAGKDNPYANVAQEAQSAAYGFDVNRFKNDQASKVAQLQNAMANSELDVRIDGNPILSPNDPNRLATIPELEQRAEMFEAPWMPAPMQREAAIIRDAIKQAREVDIPNRFGINRTVVGRQY